ncbi:MAG: transglycosylase domain-containing protein [Christensenellales bacterium]|jgi:penicillin-binding protein 1A
MKHPFENEPGENNEVFDGDIDSETYYELDNEDLESRVSLHSRTEKYKDLDTEEIYSASGKGTDAQDKSSPFKEFISKASKTVTGVAKKTWAAVSGFFARLFKKRDEGVSAGKFSSVMSKVFASIAAAFTAAINKISTLFSKLRKRDESDSYEYQDYTDGTRIMPITGEHNSYGTGDETKQIGTISSPIIDSERLTSGSSEYLTIFKERTRPRNPLLSVVLTSFSLILVLLLVFASAGAGALLGIAKAYRDTTPTLDTAQITDSDQTSFIYDSNNKLIATYAGIENRVWERIGNMPEMLKNAFVAIEDVRFYSHQGIDYKRLVGAFINNMQNDSTHGGSTITQQLIKLKVLSSERSYKRKLQEAFLALEFEQVYTKDQILEAYLNTAYFGESNYGVKSAAQDYFGKELSQLTIRECAMLAGLAQNGNYYNPRKNYYPPENSSRKRKTTDDRTDTALRRMYTANFITKAEYEAAIKEEVNIIETSKQQELYEMPYFVEYAIYDICTQLLNKRGLQNTKQNRNTVENEIRTGGYRIYLTVDPEIQKTVQDSLTNWNKYPKMRNRDDNYSSQGVIQPQASAVVIDYHTGDIKALVGGRDTPTQKKEMNRVYQTTMPIGSTIKPIAVFGPALDLGASPGSIISNGHESYPDNRRPLSGGGPAAPVTLRESLRRSYNRATYRALFEYAGGPSTSRDYLINLGVDPDHILADGPGLALGTSPINPIELTAAFGAVANKGEYLMPLSFSKVLDNEGKILLDADEIHANNKRQAFSEATAWLLTDILKDAVNSGTGTAAKIRNMTVAGKTGTNDENRGVCFSGYTPYYAATVFIGHDEYKPLHGAAYAGSYAAPLWRDFMIKIHDGLENKDIIDGSAEDYGLVRATVCPRSGQRAGELCSHDILGSAATTDYWQKSKLPSGTCTEHVSLNICKDSGMLASEHCPDDSIARHSWLNFSSSSNSAYKQAYLKAIRDKYPNFSETEICTVHTAEWGEKQQSIKWANETIANVNESMKKLEGRIDQARIQQVYNLSSQLLAMTTDASVSKGALDAKTNELIAAANKLINEVNNATPTPPPQTPDPPEETNGEEED